MKTLLVLAFLAIVLPFATEARLERKQQPVEFIKAQYEFEQWVKNCSAQINFDTLTVKEVLKLRADAGSKENYDFIITSTESVNYGTGFRQGVYWPTGTVVDLPAKANPNHYEVITRGSGDLALRFVTNDPNGGYSILTISLPDIESLKAKTPCDVKIEALMR